MRKKVSVEVVSVRYMDGSEETTSVISEGVYNPDTGLLMYKTEEEGSVTAVVIHLFGNITVKVSGSINSEMIFDREKVTTGLYNTPFGRHDISIRTHEAEHVSAGDAESIALRYSLTLGGQDLGETRMKIKATYI